MWRLLSAITISLSMLLLSVSQGMAATWVDVYNPSDILMNDHNKHISYVHDLTNDPYNPFNPGKDIIYGAEIKISLYDDMYDGIFKWESVYIDLPGILDDVWTSSTNIDDISLGLSLYCVWQLNALGKLTVDIWQVSGDFFFADSTLTAYGFDKTPVPEPCTMALLGAGMGMVGLARYRKRRSA